MAPTKSKAAKENESTFTYERKVTIEGKWNFKKLAASVFERFFRKFVNNMLFFGIILNFF